MAAYTILSASPRGVVVGDRLGAVSTHPPAVRDSFPADYGQPRWVAPAPREFAAVVAPVRSLYVERGGRPRKDGAPTRGSGSPFPRESRVHLRLEPLIVDGETGDTVLVAFCPLSREWFVGAYAEEQLPVFRSADVDPFRFVPVD